MQGVLARQFRALNQWVKGIHISSQQEFMGSVFADAFGGEKEIELFLFALKPDYQGQVIHLLLESNLYSVIDLPNDIEVTSNETGYTPHVACSKDVIAINGFQIIEVQAHCDVGPDPPSQESYSDPPHWGDNRDSSCLEDNNDCPHCEENIDPPHWSD